MPGRETARGRWGGRALVVFVVVLTLAVPAIGGGTGGLFVGDAAAQSAPPVDVVFVFDSSESMDDNRYAMAIEMAAIHDRLEAADVDARYALLTYADTVTTRQGWTADFDDVDQAMDFPTRGNTEVASEAILAATSMAFRDGAERVVVLVTDEDDDGTPARRAAAVDALEGVQFVAVSPADPSASSCAIHSPPCDDSEANDLRTIAEGGTGEWLDVATDEGTIVEQVATRLVPDTTGAPTPTPSPARVSGDAHEDPANLSILNATMNRTTVEIGETVEVSVAVRNDGDQSGQFDAELADGNGTLRSATLIVPPHQTRTVRLVASVDEPGSYDLFVSHRYVGQLTVTPLRPTVVETTIRDGGRSLVANVSDARSNASVTIPLSALDLGAGGAGSLGNLTVTPTRDLDFQVRVSAAGAPWNGTGALPAGVSPIAYLLANGSLRAGDTASVSIEYPTVPAGTTLYRFEGNASGWERLPPLETADGGGGVSAVEIHGGATLALGVRQPAFAVTDVELGNDPLVVGDPVTASLTIENEGAADGSFRAKLMAGGRVVATGAVPVPTGGERQLSVTFTPEAPGTYRLVTDDGVLREFQVRPAETPSPTHSAAETAANVKPVIETSGQAGFGVALLAVVLATLAVWVRRRT